MPYWWQREKSNLKPRIFGNFCRDFPPFLAHPVATIAKSRVSGWPMQCGSWRVFCRYCIAFHWRGDIACHESLLHYNTCYDKCFTSFSTK